MPTFDVLLLKLLVFAEPLLTAAALLALLRGRPGRTLAPMRGYLWARLATSSWQNVLLLGDRFLPAYRIFWSSAYFYSWVAGILIILGFLYRAVAVGLTSLLADLPGLLDMARLLFRWLMVAGLLLLLPSGTQLVRDILARQPLLYQILSFLRAYSMAELLPLALILTIATRRRLSPHTRPFGVMAGLCLEPGYNLVRSWFIDHAFWGWGNFWNQIVTDAMLALWLVYFMKKDPPVYIAPATAQMLHWDRIAHRTLKFRSAAVWSTPVQKAEEESPPVAGGWPTLRAAGGRGSKG